MCIFFVFLLRRWRKLDATMRGFAVFWLLTALLWFWVTYRYVVVGIGFLGAGAILHQGHTTKGLTTAAALWTTAAIGMACGCGMFVLAFITTLFTLILLWVLKPFKIHLDKMRDNENET